MPIDSKDHTCALLNLKPGKLPPLPFPPLKPVNYLTEFPTSLKTALITLI